MDIRVLKYFLTVIEEKSICAAADKLHMTQPPLSKQLRLLEEELGAPLLVRGKKQISLTPEGELLRKKAEEIIQLVNSTMLQVSAFSNSLSGEIHVGCMEGCDTKIFAKAIYIMQNKYPNIRYKIFTGDGNYITNGINQGTIDFGMVLDSINIEKYDFIKLENMKEMGLLLRKNDYTFSSEYITPEEIMDKPLLCPSDKMFKNELTSWGGRNFESLNIVAVYDAIYNILPLVEEGVGYALCIKDNILEMNSSKLMWKVLKPSLVCSQNIIWKHNPPLSNINCLFLDIIRNTLSLD